MRLSPEEFAAVASAAEREGLAVGAWVGEAVWRAAGDVADLPLSWIVVVQELVRARTNLVALTAAIEGRRTNSDTAGLAVAVGGTIERLDDFIDVAMKARRP